MNRSDDCAGPLFATGSEEGFGADKGTSKGAAAFVNNAG